MLIHYKHKKHLINIPEILCVNYKIKKNNKYLFYLCVKHNVNGSIPFINCIGIYIKGNTIAINTSKFNIVCVLYKLIDIPNITNTTYIYIIASIIYEFFINKFLYFSKSFFFS